MCGIVGELRFDGRTASPSLLRAMSRRLVHRGPDGAGFHFDGALSLGHRRLAIVDEAGGAQPLHNEDRGIWLVCNGQIDNAPELRRLLEGRGHRFRTESDNEVVVHLYEEHPEAFVQKLQGMYSLALWDGHRRRLTLLRDPFGIKPLYYSLSRQGLRFASEPKALLAIPGFDRAVDPIALRDCLLDLAVSDARSAFRNLRRLPAGHRLVVERGEVRVSRYFEPARAQSAPEAESPATAAIELRRRLDHCVAASLRADKTVGVFLSGGLDSSAIVALASRHAPGLPTFSARIDSPGYDESGYSLQVATHFGTDHHELRITRTDVTRALPGLLDQLDEPFADASVVPTYLLSRFARSHVKAAIGGEGMDELHGGNFWHQRPRPTYSGLTTWPGETTDQLLGDLPTRDFVASIERADRDAAPGDRSGARRTREQRLRGDLAGYLPSDLLHKLDRGGMFASLELRVPALNRFFADHATALPVSWRVDARRGKKLVRRAFRELLPASVLTRPKQGFALPIDNWLWETGPLRDQVREVLFSQRSRNRGLFEPAAVERLWSQHDRLEALHGYRLWTLFVIEAWHQRFIDSAGGASS